MLLEYFTTTMCGPQMRVPRPEHWSCCKYVRMDTSESVHETLKRDEWTNRESFKRRVAMIINNLSSIE